MTARRFLFLVGTEEGRIHKCSKAYSSQSGAQYSLLPRRLGVLIKGSAKKMRDDEQDKEIVGLVVPSVVIHSTHSLLKFDSYP